MIHTVAVSVSPSASRTVYVNESVPGASGAAYVHVPSASQMTLPPPSGDVHPDSSSASPLSLLSTLTLCAPPETTTSASSIASGGVFPPPPLSTVIVRVVEAVAPPESVTVSWAV